jgi:MFS family permease
MTRNVKVLSGVSLAQDAASELVYPLLPVLLTTVLGAPAAVVGLIEGIAEGVAAALKYVSGRISDRVGRRPAVLAGYGLAAMGKVVVAAAMIWPMVLAGRVVDRIGKGIRGAPRDALLAEEVPAESLGRAFGFHRAADTVGAVVGPLLGVAVLTATGGEIRAALWLAVVPAVLSVGLILLVRENRPTAAANGPTSSHPGTPDGHASPGPAPSPHPGTAADPTGARRAEAAPTAAADPTQPLPRPVRTLAAVLGLFALVNFPDALILLRLTEVGLAPTALMGAYALFNVAAAAIAYPAGALSDRWPKSRVYAVGLLCFATGYLGLGLVDTPGAAVLLLLAYGGFTGITEGVGRAWITALAPATQRGRAQGLFQALGGAGILVAGLWAGLLWGVGAGAGTVPLLVSGSVAAAAAVGLLVAGSRLEPGGPR